MKVEVELTSSQVEHITMWGDRWVDSFRDPEECTFDMAIYKAIYDAINTYDRVYLDAIA